MKPAFHMIDVGNKPVTHRIAVASGEIVVGARLTIEKDARAGMLILPARFRYQACNERPDEGRSHHAFRPARTRIGRWAMNTAPPELREIVKARHPQQRAATGDDTAADMVRGRSVGCERRSARSGRARTRKGRARGAAGDSIGNGSR